MGPDQLAELVDRYGSALVLYARQWCDCPEDVVQTALLKLCRQRTPPDNLIPWLYRVVRNGAIDASRACPPAAQVRGRRGRQRSRSGSRPPTTPPASTLVPQHSPSPTCPAETREIIVMHVWGSLTFEQIAQAVESSAATCYRRYAEGLEKLRLKLGVERPAKTQKTK